MYAEHHVNSHVAYIGIWMGGVVIQQLCNVLGGCFSDLILVRINGYQGYQHSGFNCS